MKQYLWSWESDICILPFKELEYVTAFAVFGPCVMQSKVPLVCS